MGEERFERYMRAFDEEPPVSIRLNPLKLSGENWEVVDGEPVPWCRDGYYLPCRPNFTMDPLLHAGCYYVQEASSMFICHVLQQLVDRPVSMLDLCAAPGGKSTAAIATLPAGSTLCSNEPIRLRASILAENITKWGYPDCNVTNLYPRDVRKSKRHYDVILCDVPCSGEGMFRKDESTIREWSLQNVEKCWRLQRDIVSDAWACLNDGGLLIYSTCTFNTKENEENVRWMCEQFDAELLAVPIRPEWKITGSLLPGFDAPVYRFIPGFTRGEGLFMAVLRKPGELRLINGEFSKVQRSCVPAVASERLRVGDQRSGMQSSSATFQVALSYPQAIAYLQRQALQLPPDTPRGIVEVTFMGKTLGTCKNIGNRANNLYPQEWRIRTTHVPTDYEPVIVRRLKG